MSVAMPEAFTEKWQEYGDQDLKILVAVCNLMKMNLIASKPFLEGRLSDVEIP